MLLAPLAAAALVAVAVLAAGTAETTARSRSRSRSCSRRSPCGAWSRSPSGSPGRVRGRGGDRVRAPALRRTIFFYGPFSRPYGGSSSRRSSGFAHRPGSHSASGSRSSSRSLRRGSPAPHGGSALSARRGVGRHRWTRLYDNFHETTWSPTLLSLLPFACALGVGLRSPWPAAALGGWLGFFVLRGVHQAVCGGAFWPSLAAAMPAIAVLLTSLGCWFLGSARRGAGCSDELAARSSLSLELEQRDALRENDVLVGERREHRRVVEQHREARRAGRRRTARPADRPRRRPRRRSCSAHRARPRGRQDDARQQPEQRVPLLQPP